MLSYQKHTLLALLAQFEAKFYEEAESVGAMTENDPRFISAGQTIARNIQSIRKQINRL